MDKSETQDPKIKDENQNEAMVKNFEDNKFSFTPKMIAVLVGLIVLGTVGGYAAANFGPTVSTGGSDQSGETSDIKKGTIFGSNDTKTFKDIAEGTVKKGGIDGEGQYHLVRPGGESQNVYMTSSVVDLSILAGKKVKVWGQTMAAQKAGWLMDVGRVEVQ